MIFWFKNIRIKTNPKLFFSFFEFIGKSKHFLSIVVINFFLCISLIEFIKRFRCLEVILINTLRELRCKCSSFLIYTLTFFIEILHRYKIVIR